jgi:hypothetical protein
LTARVPLDARGAPRTLPPPAARACARLRLPTVLRRGRRSPLPPAPRARALGRRARRERGRGTRSPTRDRRELKALLFRSGQTRSHTGVFESAAVGAVEEASAARGKPPPRAGSFWTVFRRAREPGRALIRRATELRPSGRELAAAALRALPADARRRRGRARRGGITLPRARPPPPSPRPTLRRAATSPV